MSKVDDTFINLVNENSDVHRIAEYIFGLYPDIIEFEDAIKIAKAVVQEKKYTKNQILEGYASDDIYKHVMAVAIARGSVIEADEEPQLTPLKTVKKVFKKGVIIALLLSLLGTALLLAYKDYKDYKRDTSISQSIGMLASNKGTYEYENKASIVAQNRYTVSRDEEGNAIVAYYPDRIAEDIATVCENDPKLFDITISNVYFELENRLETMDNIWAHLRGITSESENENLKVIDNRINTYDVFLEYIFNRGFIDPNDPNYYVIMEDIQQYKELKQTTDGIAFYALPEESQKRLQALVNEYETNQDILYERYGDTVIGLANGDTLETSTEPEGRNGR